MKKWLLAFAIAALILFTSVPAMAHQYGCTPGFWKNHTNWAAYGISYLPTTKLSTAFPGLNGTFPDGSHLNTNATLLEALSFKGGSSLAEASQILLRAAVAKLLNLKSGVQTPNSTGDINNFITYIVNATVYHSGDRAYIIGEAAFWDAENNAPLGCPLS